MKKSEFDFTVPNRQSYVAILLILFKTINVVFRQLLPVLFVFLIGGSGKKGDYILYTVIGIAILSMLYSVLNFFRTYFYIKDDELILHSGVIQHKKISIPFARIQTINFEQNIIHQFFGVLKLNVDSAGSDKNEFEFHAIEDEKANALRALILQEKTLMAGEDDTSGQTSEDLSQKEYKTIMSLSTLELFKAGLTENHIKSGGLILLFFFWIYQNLQEVGVDVDEYSNELPDYEFGIYSIIFVGFLLAFVSIFISLTRTVIKNFDLQFLRSNQGFKIISGLFTKREVSALDHKIQYISWSDNVLKRIVGFKDLSLFQASSAEIKTKQSITIPGCKQNHIQSVVTTLFGETDFTSFPMYGIDFKYFTRFTFIIVILSIILSTITFYFYNLMNIVFIILIGLYLIMSRYISYKKKAFGYDDSLIYIKGGIFGDKAEILPMYKIQGIHLHESPYQTRNNLCSITLNTASGSINIPYISQTIGSKLADMLIYKVESDKRKWM